MCGYTTCIALITFAAIVNASELSCEDGSCVAEAGVALLQNRNHRSMKINRVGETSHDEAPLGRCEMSLQDMDLSEEGYKRVKAACCFDAMSAFIARLTEENFKICGSGFAPGLALWHSCEGEGAKRTFEELKQSIMDQSKVKCTALSAKTDTCKPRPADCPDYSGVQKPSGCDCSASKLVDLDFNANLIYNNLGGKGPENPGSLPDEMRFEKIGQTNIDGEIKDFDLSIRTVGVEYIPGNISRNGQAHEAPFKFGRISLKKGNTIKLGFKFFLTGSDSTTVTLSDVAFSFFDLDGNINSRQTGMGFEGVRATDFAGYVLEDDSYLTVETEDGETRFRNKALTNVRDYVDPMQLTPEQRKGSVMLYFKNVSYFEMTYAVNPERPSDNAQETKNVTMLFAGKSSLIDHCSA